MSEQVETFIKKAKTAAGMIQAELGKAVESIAASDNGKAKGGAEAQPAAPVKEDAENAVAAPDSPKADAATAQEAPCAGMETACVAEAKGEPVSLTADEQEFLTLYKSASADTKKVAMFVLKSEKQLVPQIMSMVAGVVGNGSANSDNPVARAFGGGNAGSDNPVQGVIGGLMGVVGSMMGKKGSGDKPDKEISGSLLVFTYLYSISIYILLLSFYFWLWRTDIKPEKQEKPETSKSEQSAKKK
jgi:hypothetical protein